jgi:hypothetical protein
VSSKEENSEDFFPNFSRSKSLASGVHKAIQTEMMPEQRVLQKVVLTGGRCCILG